MKRLKHDIGLRVIKLLNVVLMSIPFILCWYLYYAERTYVPFFGRGNWVVAALFVVLYILFARIYDAFLVSVNRISEMVYSQGLAALISDGIMFVVIWLLTRHFPNLLPGLAALATQLLLAVVWSVLAHKWYYHSFPPKKTAVVYEHRYGMEKLICKYDLQKKFQIQFTVSAEECCANLDMLRGVETVFVSGVSSHERNVILKHCISHNIDVYVIPRIGDIIMSGAKRVHMFHLPVLRVGKCNPHPEAKFLKRAFDIIVSSLILLLTSPIMIVVAIAIKLDDGGPVFYKQERLTIDGKVFKILKFRSMYEGSDKNEKVKGASDKDDRITPVGHVIRKLRIDELPQMLNILSGSMSVVGPRPEWVEFAKKYEKELPEFRLRLQIKAGLTGYAQVYGKYNTAPYDKLQMDLMYIANPSFLEDLRIIFATIKILFMPESTEGFTEEQNAAMTAAEKPEKDREEELQSV